MVGEFFHLSLSLSNRGFGICIALFPFSLFFSCLHLYYIIIFGVEVYVHICMYVYTSKGLLDQHHKTEIVEGHDAVPVVSTSHISNHLIGLSFYPSSLRCLPLFFFVFLMF